MKKLDRTSLKLIAIVTMTISHFAVTFVNPGTILYKTCLYIGYFTAITMCYFLAEGYHYTSSRKKYGQRLLIFALISQIPYGMVIRLSGGSFMAVNMMYTLFISFMVLVVNDKLRTSKYRILAITGLILLTAFSDWGILAPVFTLLFYMNRGSEEGTRRAFALALALQAINGFTGRFMLDEQWIPALIQMLCSVAAPAVVALIIIKFYNGEKTGKQLKNFKWLFYIYYPLHLAIFAGIKIGFRCI